MSFFPNPVTSFYKKLVWIIGITLSIVLLAGVFVFLNLHHNTILKTSTIQKPTSITSTSSGRTPTPPQSPPTSPEGSGSLNKQSTSSTSPVNSSARTPNSPAPPVPAQNPTRTQVAAGTPHVTYTYMTNRVNPMSSACDFNTDVTVSADSWQGYNTGKIVVSIVYHSYYGDYPYTLNYALSPGETKVLSQNLSIPPHPNGDSITASVSVRPAGTGAGEVMMITDTSSAGSTDGLNCF